VAAAPLEVADIFRRFRRCISSSVRRCARRGQLRAMSAIERCRTAALGGTSNNVTPAAIGGITYNSCRHRVLSQVPVARPRAVAAGA